MKYRIALIGIVLGYLMTYVGIAILNGFLLFLIAPSNKDAFWCGFGFSILPGFCWVEIGIIQLISWIATGDFIHSETIFRPIDWYVEKADEEKKKKKLCNEKADEEKKKKKLCNKKADEEKKEKKLCKTKILKETEMEYEKEYQKALKKLNKQFPGVRL